MVKLANKINADMLTEQAFGLTQGVMEYAANNIQDLSMICASTPVTQNHELLLQKLLRVLPRLNFVNVLTRGGWHRSGGIVDAQGSRVADSIRDWVEERSGFSGDIVGLADDYADSGYIATSLMGKTHYFVAQTGETARDFVQLEVEELLEIKDHVMFEDEVLPEDIEDLVDPVECRNIAHTAVQAPRYAFRRITPVAGYMKSMSDRMMDKGNKYMAIQRFMDDWDRSSSRESGAFCFHWVLGLQQYTDAWGEPVMQAKPVSTYSEALPAMNLNDVHRGAELANLIHGFDHDVGYPMAWYFFMLSHIKVPHSLAEAIHNDQMGAYDYLPVRDMKILKDWSAKPYAI